MFGNAAVNQDCFASCLYHKRHILGSGMRLRSHHMQVKMCAILLVEAKEEGMTSCKCILPPMRNHDCQRSAAVISCHQREDWLGAFALGPTHRAYAQYMMEARGNYCQLHAYGYKARKDHPCWRPWGNEAVRG